MAIKIKDWSYEANFVENAKKALELKNKASDKLTEEFNKSKYDLEHAEPGDGNISINYYQAYLNYMSTDNAHAKTYLDFIKESYDELTYTRDRIADKEEAESILIELESLFDTYIRYCGYLEKNEEVFNQALNTLKATKVLSSTGILYELKMLETLHGCDAKHLTIHNSCIEPLRDNVANPLLSKITAFVFSKAEEVALYDSLHKEQPESE